LNLNGNSDRLDEVVRTYAIHKDISVIGNYLNMIDSVTTDKISKVVSKLV